MRITNSMMTANTKANININKLYSDKLNSQIASGQKIVRPSDDPVVAIRAMRLNTTIDELTQYSGKNIPDADAWYTDTETALSQADEVLASIREKLNQASSQENVTSNVKDILEELKQLSAQYYALGNADCAGRTVFTGYRTSEMLTFTEDDTIEYEIYEKASFSKFEESTYISGTKEINIAGDNINNYTSYSETDIKEETSYRLRLSYDNLMAGTGNDITIKDATGNVIKSYAGVSVISTAGKTQAEIDELYTKGQKDAAGDYHPVIIKETGELILPKADYDDALVGNAADIEIKYHKSEWQKDDPRPEHYFMCNTPVDENDPRTYETVADTSVNPVVYNKVPIEYNYNRVDANGDPTTSRTYEAVKKDADGNPVTDASGNPVMETKDTEVKGFKEQAINYEIAYNQTIQINTNASNTFSHDIGRDIDDLVNITEEVINAESNTTAVKEAYESETDPVKKAKYETLLAAVEKQETLLKNKMHDMYSKAITKFKEHAETVNNEISKIGALTSRLELTKNRIVDQKTNVKQIADDNINIDLSEAAIDFKSAQLALEAAEMAAGKIASQTLLNYI